MDFIELANNLDSSKLFFCVQRKRLRVKENYIWRISDAVRYVHTFVPFCTIAKCVKILLYE